MTTHLIEVTQRNDDHVLLRWGEVEIVVSAEIGNLIASVMAPATHCLETVCERHELVSHVLVGCVPPVTLSEEKAR